MQNSRDKVLFFCFIFSVFAFFFIFFFQLHPITVSDTDDWSFLIFHRSALPIWNGWNPIRVFAEVTMPAVSEISAALFYPFTKNIFIALTLGYSISISIVITCLTGMLFCMLKERLSSLRALLFCLLFLISHFWIFRTDYQHNDYMLRTVDACTVFFYVIPNLLNSFFVLWIEKDQKYLEWQPATSYSKLAVFVVLAYFCIFSNIWSGMILSAYSGSKLLFSLHTLKRDNLKKWLSKNSMFLIIIVFWIISQIYELNGGRAADIGKKVTDELPATLKNLYITAKNVNHKYFAVMSILLFGGLFVIFRRKDKSAYGLVGIWGVSVLLSLLYIIISCSKAGSSFSKRPDVFYGLFFFGFMLVTVCGEKLIEEIPLSKAVIPLMLIIIINDCFSGGRTFRESNVLNISPKIINNINNDIVHQLKEAEKEGLDMVKIEIPKFNTKDNWPYATYAAVPIGESMWKLGVIEKNVTVEELVPNTEKNVLITGGVLDSEH